MFFDEKCLPHELDLEASISFSTALTLTVGFQAQPSLTGFELSKNMDFKDTQRD